MDSWLIGALQSGAFCKNGRWHQDPGSGCVRICLGCKFGTCQLHEAVPVELDDVGQLPAFKVDSSGLTCMTLEVPSVQSKDAWNSFLQLLSLADGIVILRIADDAEHDQEGYLSKSPLLAEAHLLQHGEV
eukprot:symbB.v1.2.029456.t1/scaffold3157.1/size62199/2